MDFYNQLSKYYDEIFPVSEVTVDFLVDNIGSVPKSLLDIACGSGNYSLELGRKGYDVTGVDLSSNMISIAKQKPTKDLAIQFIQGDMRTLEGIDSPYDGAFCLGNSFVHLLTDQDMMQALATVNSKLERWGTLVIQTVNYDRILKFHVTQLPTINRAKSGIVFERYYDFIEDGLVDFRTVLKTREGTFSSAVPLRPLLIGRLRSLLTDSGFNVLEGYGSFDGRLHEADTPATIVVAKKI